MKNVQLKVSRVIDGVVRQPAEGAIPVSDELAEQLVQEEAAELVDDGDGLDIDYEDDLDGENVADLKALAELENVDLGDATRKADIIDRIRAHRLANPAE